MPFSRYMDLCLYDPENGYYSRSAEQFGKAGDFFTSSDVHAVFGRLLSRQFAEMWQLLGRPPKVEILELGPGRGLFARDVLDWSKKKFPELFAATTYTLQESSPALREKLAVNLGTHISEGKARLSAPHVETRLAASQKAEISTKSGNKQCIHRSCPPETPLIIFANEFFDALPVEILSSHGKLHLSFESNRLTEVWLPPPAGDLDYLDRYGVHPEPGERIEVPLAAQHWIAEAASAIGRGFLLVIDYGYTRGEQLAGRHRETLMAYRQHSASANPYEAPGEQDMTAHVNFTALAAGAGHAGMMAQELVTQSQFLLGIGENNQFADAFEECRLPQEKAKVALQLKHLITPEGMGETFKVLVASRGVEPEKARSLIGLGFGRG